MVERFGQWLEPALALGRQGPPMLRALIALVGARAEVCFDATTATAHLGWDPASGRFLVAIGPRILDEVLRGPEDLLYVIAHELVHLVRGEHRLPPGDAAIAYNLAADALNDAWLTGPALEGFFAPTLSLPSRRPASGPDLGLLIPLEAAAQRLGRPSGAAPAETSRLFFERVVQRPTPAGVTPYTPQAWAIVHHALQLGGRDDTLSLDVAARMVLPLLSQLPVAPASRPSLAAALPIAAQDALEALRAAFAASGRPGDGRAGAAGSGAAVTTTELPRARASRRLAKFLRGLVEVSPGVAPTWSPRGLEERAADAGSRLGSRSLVEYRAGLRATPWRDGVPRGGVGPFGLAIYLDVSASMWRELPPIVATIGRTCADILALPVIAFSIGARPIALRELAAGRMPSDRGTGFVALAEDLLARHVERAVVITDGIAPPLPQDLHRRLKARGLRVAIVFPGRSGTSPLDAFCPSGWKLGLDLLRRGM